MAYKTKNPYELKKLEAKRRAKRKRLMIAGSIAAAVIIIIAAAVVIPKLLTDDTETARDTSKPHVLITMADGGEIELELEPEAAPKTAANFVKLADEGFYDGLTFHRVSPTFMIQGGDPNGDGTGGSSETIEGEFSVNGWQNNISHTRGVISMARSNDNNSASSQFFIMTSDNTGLDGSYAAFGRVISGMDVVDRIASVETTALGDGTGTPITPPVMESVVVLD